MTFLSRRGLLLATFATSLVSLFAAKPVAPAGNYVLTVTPDHPGALYQQGERVSFAIKLTQAGQPVDGADVTWTTAKDGVAPTQSGKLKLTGGMGAVQAKLDEPGFVQCRVSFTTPEKSNVVAIGGAGFDPLKIKPSMPPPEDFDSFWTAQKSQLAAVPVNARLTPEKSGSGAVEVFDAQLDSVGPPVSGYFARPLKARTKSLPVILTVHGAGVSSSSLGGAAGWAAKGFLAMDINAHGIPNGKAKEFYAELANGALKDYRARGRESRETVYFRGMFLRLVRALDFLTSQPEWDGRTVVVHGSSQGGYQSIVAAGLDERVTFIAAGVPAGCDHTGFKAGRVNGWPKFITSNPPENPSAKVVDAVRYYDCVNFAARSKASAIFTVGFIDSTCPPTSVYAAYNALPGRKEIFNDVTAGHTNTPKATEAMRNAIARHVEEMRKK